MADFGSDKMQLGALKSFADGSLGSTTAWFFDPYSDAPDTRGIPSPQLLHPAEMYEEMRSADKAGLQLAVQAIGDRANQTILGMFEKLEVENGSSDRRLRIAGDDAQLAEARDIRRRQMLCVLARCRHGVGVRIGLVRCADQPADGNLRRRNPSDFGWQAPKWMRAGAKHLSGCQLVGK
jgi:predicted amidohydrolase YtcJ